MDAFMRCISSPPLVTKGSSCSTPSLCSSSRMCSTQWSLLLLSPCLCMTCGLKNQAVSRSTFQMSPAVQPPTHLLGDCEDVGTNGCHLHVSFCSVSIGGPTLNPLSSFPVFPRGLPTIQWGFTALSRVHQGTQKFVLDVTDLRTGFSSVILRYCIVRYKARL